MPVEAAMKSLGHFHGRDFYLADEGFDRPGIYYWNGKKNVHVDDVIAAVEFYARHEHWMGTAEDGPQKLLIANGDTSGVDGWAVAEDALSAA